MPPLPPEVYIPIAGAMGSSIVALWLWAKAGWASKAQGDERMIAHLEKDNAEMTRVIVLDTEALNASTRALEELGHATRRPGNR